MSMPNPQYDQIIRILSKPSFAAYEVHEGTRYFVEDIEADRDKEVDCLGIYYGDEAVLFGEWQGLEDQRPRVSVEQIARCRHAFLVRSATDDEIEQLGGRRVVVLLEVQQRMNDINGYTEKIIFRTTRNVGGYNPIV